MKLFLFRLAVAAELFVVVLAAGAQQAPVPMDALKTCKNEVGARYLSVPMAYISIDRGSKTANGNYLVNWATKPAEGKGSVGFCVVDPSFYILRFETSSGPQPDSGQVRVTPEDALLICKNQVFDRLRIVPMEDITVEPAKDLAEDGYFIHWKEKTRGGVGRSGSCLIAPDGKVSKFELDNPSLKPSGGR